MNSLAQFFLFTLLCAISKQGKSVFVEFVSNRIRQICRWQTKKATSSERGKTCPMVTKTLNFHFRATQPNYSFACSNHSSPLFVIWSESTAQIWRDFPNKSNNEFCNIFRANRNIIQICHFMAVNVISTVFGRIWRLSFKRVFWLDKFGIKITAGSSQKSS